MQSNNKKRIIKMADIVTTNAVEEETTRPSFSNPKKHGQEKKEQGGAPKDQTKSFFEELEAIGKSDSIAGKQKKERKQLTKRQVVNRVLFIAGAVIVIGGGVAGAATLLPKVVITIDMHKTPWSFSDAVKVSKNAIRIETETMTVPGEVFTQEKSAVLSFPASGEGHVERKATGTLFIVNAYSTDSQLLVKNTRFETPQGLIFRLTDAITVPGAQEVNGVIQPSRIAASVVADQPGPQYNIGPVEKLTIPGFAGSDRFNGFYGVSESAMEGGMIGTSRYPTQEDKDAALEKAEETMRAQLGSFLGTQIPEGFTIIEGSQHIQIGDSEINETVGDDNMFTVTMSGTARGIIFKESDVLEALRLRSIGEEDLDQDLVVREYTLSYQEPNVNWDTGIMSVPVSYTSVLWKPVDADSIRANSVGKNEVDLKTSILAMPGVDKLSVSLWPFWVKTVPEKESRVEVVIQ